MPRVNLIQVRGGTAADWTSANPVLGLKEPGVETDTLLTKYGDGVTEWDSLPYATVPKSYVDGAIGTVDTTGGTLTLNFTTKSRVSFVNSAPFAAAKAVAFSNDVNAKAFEFIFEITNVAATLDFPANTKASDVRWNSGTQVWTPNEVGIFKVTGVYSGSNWYLDFSPAPYV